MITRREIRSFDSNIPNKLSFLFGIVLQNNSVHNFTCVVVWFACVHVALRMIVYFKNGWLLWHVLHFLYDSQVRIISYKGTKKRFNFFRCKELNRRVNSSVKNLRWWLKSQIMLYTLSRFLTVFLYTKLNISLWQERFDIILRKQLINLKLKMIVDVIR